MKKLKLSKRNDDTANVLTVRSKSERVIYAIVFVVFLVYALSLIYPLVYLFINSFQDKLTYTLNMMEGEKLFTLPKEWHFENYQIALTGMTAVSSRGEFIYLPEMFFNSFWYCGISILGSTFMNALVGYTMAKYNFKGREFIYAVAITFMTLPIVGTGGAAFKLTYDLGLYNTPMKVVISSLGSWGYHFLIMYGFFKNMSWNYAEAVFLDGGGHGTAFFKVMLPQATTLMVTLGIMSFIGVWNDYMGPLLYLPDYPTVASGIYEIKTSFSRNGNVPALYAGLILFCVPIIILFSFCSDTIMKNFTVGGLKG